MSVRFWVGAAIAVVALLLIGARAHAATDTVSCELQDAARAETPSGVCLACHDGSASDPVAFSAGAHGTGADAHPLDVDYFDASTRDRRLAQPYDLPRIVVLVNGAVACTSCHDGGSPYHARIAGGMARLCASCHRR